MKLLEWKTYEDYFSNHIVIGYIAVAIALVFQVYTMVKFDSILNLTYTLPKHYIGISIIYAILTCMGTFPKRYFNRITAQNFFFLLLICLALTDPANEEEMMNTKYIIPSYWMYQLKITFNCLCVILFSLSILRNTSVNVDRK